MDRLGLLRVGEEALAFGPDKAAASLGEAKDTLRAIAEEQRALAA